MGKLKGKKKLNKRITKIFRGFGIDSAKLSDGFYYIESKSSIKFSVAIGTESEWLIDFVKDHFDYEPEFPFMLLFLHEIGHHFTLPTLSAEVRTQCNKSKVELERKMAQTDIVDEWKDLERKYFNLPDEFAATSWAVHYMKMNPFMTSELAMQIQRAFCKFYMKNDVELD